MSETVDIPLSYLIRENQQHLADDLSYLGQCFGFPRNLAERDLEKFWRPTNQYMAWARKLSNDTGAIMFRVDFLDVHLDPAYSEWVYGDARVTDSFVAPVPEHGFSVDNCGGTQPDQVDHTDTATLAQERSTHTDQVISNDLTGKVTGSVGGDSTGAKLEISVEDTFGWKTDKGEAEAKSESQTEAIAIHTEVPAGEAFDFDVVADRRHIATPFCASGPWTGGVRISIRDRYEGDPGGPFTAVYEAWQAHSTVNRNDFRSIEWPTWDGFIQTLMGYDTTRPEFTRQATEAIRDVAARLDNIGRRRIALQGIERRVVSQNARYTTSARRCGSIHPLTGGVV